MANRIVAGAVAGAAGVVALNAAGYLDMLIRGRPASDLPTRVAGKLADEMGLPLDFDGDADAGGGEDDDDRDDELGAATQNRRDALGALLGMATGIGVGVAYGLCRLILPRPPAWLAGAVLGAASMAASDYPASRLEVAEPRDWSATDWAGDVLPHMAFGVVAALAFEAARD